MNSEIDRERFFARQVPAQQRAWFSAQGGRTAMFTRQLRGGDALYLNDMGIHAEISQPGNTFHLRVRNDNGRSPEPLD